MDYLNKLRSSVSSVAASVSGALPGNPVLREYEVVKQIASAGISRSWKVYSGRKISTKQPVAVWLFEKRDIENWPKREKELFIELLKNGVSKLTRLRHPRLLIVERPLEESRESLAFCSEPIFASLANCFGSVDNISAMPAQLADFRFLDIEIRHGLLQLAEALTFLHNDARMLHRNLCLDSVIINEKGAWKLFGFDFCVQGVNSDSNSGLIEFEALNWDEVMMPVVQPLLDYLAPEYIIGSRCDAYSDMYSLGVLSYAVLNGGRAPFENQNNIKLCKSNIAQLKTISPTLLQVIPEEFRDDVKMCLNATGTLRPDAIQFSKIAYFQDPLIKTLNYFESLCQMDNAQKSEFFKELPTVLVKFPKRPLLQKILPFLCGEFATADLIPFILPSIFMIAETVTADEYAIHLLPHITPLFSITKPNQIALMLLQKIELLLDKTPEDAIRNHIVQFAFNSLADTNTKIQEMCLTTIPRLANSISRDRMKTHFLPKLLQLAIESNTLAIKVQSLLCIGSLLPQLQNWMATDQVLPALPRVNSKEPAVLMAILGIYKLIYEKFGISKEQCARNALPFLIANSIENSLNTSQFDQFLSTIRVLLTKVETEQRQSLQQRSSMQEDMRSVADFNTISQTVADGATKELTFEINEPESNRNRTPFRLNTNVPTLSLEEKKRIASEQERTLRLRQEPALVATIPSIKPTNATSSVAARSSKSTSAPVAAGLDDLLSSNLNFHPPAMLPAQNTSSNTFGGAFDMQQFMMSSSSSSNSAATPVNLQFLPPPPPSSNTPVRMQTPFSSNAPKPNHSAFDNLVSFPAPPRNDTLPPRLDQQKSSAAANGNRQRDPFADLLG